MKLFFQNLVQNLASCDTAGVVLLLGTGLVAYRIVTLLFGV